MGAKYRLASMWKPKVMQDNHGVGIWNSIVKGNEKLYKFISFPRKAFFFLLWIQVY